MVADDVRAPSGIARLEFISQRLDSVIRSVEILQVDREVAIFYPGVGPDEELVVFGGAVVCRAKSHNFMECSFQFVEWGIGVQHSKGFHDLRES